MGPIQIVVADDSKTIRTQLKRALTPVGYDVRLADGAEEALRQIREQCPHLLILDINMPGLDGYGVCGELQQMGEPWSQVPVVFLTSVDAHALEMLGAALGAYLKKPASEQVIRDTVARVLAQRQVAVDSPREPSRRESRALSVGGSCTEQGQEGSA